MLRQLVGAFRDGKNRAKALRVLSRTFSLILTSPQHHGILEIVSEGSSEIWNEYEVAVMFIFHLYETADVNNPKVKKDIIKYTRIVKGQHNRNLVSQSVQNIFLDMARDRFNVDTDKLEAF